MLKLSRAQEIKMNREECEEIVRIKGAVAELKQMQIDLFVKLQLSKNHGAPCEHKLQQELVYDNQIKRIDCHMSSLRQILMSLGEEVRV